MVYLCRYNDCNLFYQAQRCRHNLSKSETSMQITIFKSFQQKFEDTARTIRSQQLKKDIQCNISNSMA